MGDSKTAGDEWLPALALRPAGPRWGWVDRGVSGASVSSTLGNLAVVLAPLARPVPPVVLINLGVNDFSQGHSPAQWQADYLTLIDAVRAQYPSAAVYLARPWMRGKTAESQVYAASIAAIIPQRTNLFLGMDERIWLEGGDDGATLTFDGVHYNAAGETAAVQAWAAVLWP